jgi:hypothetical protein
VNAAMVRRCHEATHPRDAYAPLIANHAEAQASSQLTRSLTVTDVFDVPRSPMLDREAAEADCLPLPPRFVRSLEPAGSLGRIDRGYSLGRATYVAPPC